MTISGAWSSLRLRYAIAAVVFVAFFAFVCFVVWLQSLDLCEIFRAMERAEETDQDLKQGLAEFVRGCVPVDN